MTTWNFMALQMDEIRGLAERVAASHHLEIVDVEFGGGGKSRALRVFLEKDAAERKRLEERVAAGEVEDLPKGVPVELLSGVTHEDCAAFATDFGTLLDVEDVVPGSGVHAGGFVARAGTEAGAGLRSLCGLPGAWLR